MAAGARCRVTLEVTLRRFTVERYLRILELGILSPERGVECLDGYLMRRTPQTPARTASRKRLTAAPAALLPDGWWVAEEPLLPTSTSVPQPDLAVLWVDPANSRGATRRHRR
ncbi:MAG: hypothetical protein FJX77_13205 [Armatimonadetes bacterium]|nr:hypothetical protein [Armatimonadota bacterium]